MLTNLDFLNPGEPWPPTLEKDRLLLYQNNKFIFETLHDKTKIYEEQFKRIKRVIGNFDDIISYPVIINYQKKISLKIADFLFGEPPNFSAGDEGSPEQLSLEKIVEICELLNVGYEVAIDVSRFGTGIFQVYSEEGQGIISALPPEYWFPIVSENNIKKTLFHVLGWIIKQGKDSYLKIQIHEKGRYFERVYQLVHSDVSVSIGNVINKLASPEIMYQTGLSDFAVIPVHNVLTSDRIFGIDDYTEIDSIISEILVRVGQISRILDEHAAPSMTGSPFSMIKDAQSGEWRFTAGQFFPINDKAEPELKYLTWDGQLSANFQHLEVLINALYTISEMGSAIFGDISQKAGQIPSGTALKRLMISALAKVNRIRMRFDPALKRAIKLCSELPGKGIIKLDSVSISWQDGLPGDPKEEAEIMQIRTAGKQTMSQKRAIKTYDGLSDEEADNEISQIEEDETKSNPLTVPSFGGFTANEEPEPDTIT